MNMFPLRYKLNSVFLLLAFLSSCTCYQNARGTVTDKMTGEPVQGARVYKKGREFEPRTTGPDGRYDVGCMTKGLLKCPPMIIVAEKPGYKTVETTVKTGEIYHFKLEVVPLDTTMK